MLKIFRFVLVTVCGVTQVSCVMYGSPHADYEFKTVVTTFEFPEKVKVVFEDTDGPENRGELEKDSLFIGVHQIKKADGWYGGGFRSDDVEINIRKKNI